MATPNQYYRPYAASDSDFSDADSEASWSRPSTPEIPSNTEREELSTDQLQVPDYSALAKGLNAPLLQTSGPTFPKDKVEDAYGVNHIDKTNQYSTFDVKDASGVKIKMETKDITTVVVIQSRDRDKRIFAQPTNCQLLLPRIYKNVTYFSVTQLNLTSAFFYFRQDKENLTIQILEKGNVLYQLLLKPPPSTIPLKITTTIRPGSYNISQLLEEMNTQLNRTPLFYDFLNGYNDFSNLFQINGDFSINFNQPGDNYYDSLQKLFIKNPTKSQIVGNYFQSQFANQLTYTDSQVQVAYYYPVLKEVLLDPDTVLVNYNLEATDPTTGLPLYTEETVQYLIYQFTGLNDPVAQTVIINNRTLLDNYRLQHTYRYSLVNRYQCGYDQTNNRVTIKTTSLSTSLVNLLNNQFNVYFNQQLANFNLTLAQYNTILTQTTNILSIFQSMYEFLQINFANYFAVNYNTYSRSYYANPNYSVLIRSGLDSSGTILSYTPGIVPRETDYLEDFRNNPPYYWNKLKMLGNTEGAQRNMGSPSQSFPTSSNFPYSLAQSNIDLSRPFIDLSGVVYTDLRRRAGDIVVNIDSSKYTIFQFRSKVRQTLQVETLPRQTIYRYPLWNKSHLVPPPISNLFDISYSYITPDSNLYNKITYDLSYSAIYGWSNISGTSNFGYTFSQSSNYWGSATDTINANFVNGKVYTFKTPLAQERTGPSDSNVYTYNLNITLESDNPVTTLFAFFYHDIASFSADLSGARLENPINYKYKLVLSNGVSSNTYPFLAYAEQQYYVLVRPETPTPPTVFYRVIPWFPDGTTFNTLSYSTNFNPSADPTTLLSNFNVAKNNDPAFIRLPISSNLWSNTSPSNDFINSTVFSGAPAIGYDISGISNDLTDYVPFAPNNSDSNINPAATLRVDPITNFIFQSNSPYNTSNESYFYSGSSNVIYTPGLLNTYTPQTISNRQYKILNWYATNYIHDTNLVHSYTSNDISPYVQPYSITTTSNTPLNGYVYQGSNSILYLGQGVCGFSFLPGDGTWAMQRISFKTNFLTTDPSINLNENIQCLAVFVTSEILADPVFTLNPGSNAIAICVKQSSRIYTSNSQNIGFDAGYGTYYTFSNQPDLVSRSNFQFSGYSQVGKQFIADSNSYYSVLAFHGLNTTDLSNISSSNSNTRAQAITNLKTQLSDGTANIITIQNITGSPVAYPYANQAYPSSTFYDGQSAPTGQDIVLSTSNPNPGVFGPPAGYDESVSVYEQSIPVVNSHLHYLTQSNIATDASGFNIWSNVPTAPTTLNAAVANYILFQDGQFTIAPYKTFTTVVPGESAERSFSNTEFINLTIDQIFPAAENTSLLAVSGNFKSYCFLGTSNNILRFKLYTPSTGLLTELPVNPFYTFSASNYLIHDFVFNNQDGWFLSAYDTVNNYVVLRGAPVYNESMISYNYPGYSNSQLYMDPSGANLYFVKTQTSNLGFTDFSLFSLNPSDTQFIGSNSDGYIINLSNSVPTVLPTNYKQLAVTFNSGTEEVLLLNTDQYPNNFFKISTYLSDTLSSSNTSIVKSVQSFRDASNNLIKPLNIYGGAIGSKWALFSNVPFLMGNRNDAFDAPVNINMAWQIFFPTIKIELLKLTNGSSPIIDLTNIQYPEWPHVMMFGYSNFTSLSNDIFTNGGKWGLESKSNFLVSDISFNGFYFNSYLMNFPLTQTSGGNMSNNDNNSFYLAVRGYLPTEKFQTMLRFYMPNRYDFGIVKLRDISNEVLLSSNVPNEFSPGYLNTLRQFNSNFVYINKNFGSNSVQGFTGSNYSSSNFGQFLQTYRALYQQFLSNSAIINTIQSNVNSNINAFIQNDLKYILPASALSRQRYTDPILFQILWRSALTPNFLVLDDEWGLGWNLGYAKKDTPFSTIQTGDSFYKIQQDFIYLRLNQEFNINRIDAGGKENYQTSRESTGTTNQYYCKLLLTNFGGNSTTFIHNPITFNPPLNRFTKLTFQWLYPNGTIIDNGDAEWNATVNIQERIEVPTIPDKMVFQPADPKTGKPAPLPPGFQIPKQTPEEQKK